MTTETRQVEVLTCILPFLQQKRPDYQRIQRRGPEALNSIAWRADNRLSTCIERGIDQHRHTCLSLKGLEQVIVQWVLLPVHSLNARRPVNMSHCRNKLGFLWQHVIDKQH